MSSHFHACSAICPDSHGGHVMHIASIVKHNCWLKNAVENNSRAAQLIGITCVMDKINVESIYDSSSEIPHMLQIFSIDFEYENHTYYALIRLKFLRERPEYHITVMNGTIERQLYGHHILREFDGTFRAEQPVPENVQKILTSIIYSVEKHRTATSE